MRTPLEAVAHKLPDGVREKQQLARQARTGASGVDGPHRGPRQAETGDVDEVPSHRSAAGRPEADEPDVDPAFPAAGDALRDLRGGPAEPEAAREIRTGSRRDDGQRHVRGAVAPRAHQSVDDLADRPIAADGNDEADAAACEGCGDPRGIARRGGLADVKRADRGFEDLRHPAPQPARPAAAGHRVHHYSNRHRFPCPPHLWRTQRRPVFVLRQAGPQAIWTGTNNIGQRDYRIAMAESPVLGADDAPVFTPRTLPLPPGAYEDEAEVVIGWDGGKYVAHDPRQFGPDGGSEACVGCADAPASRRKRRYTALSHF